MNVTSLHTGVLGAAKAPDSLFKGTVGTKNTDWFGLSGLDGSALFGSQLASLLAGAQANQNVHVIPLGATSASGGDPQALLSSLVQQGTPISTIGRTIAQRVSDSVRSLLAGKLSKPDLDRLSTKLAQALSNALAPPGTAPPGTASQQVAALVQRLTDLVNGLAREQTNGAGQQNEISGSFLDAKSAKEIPAQQKTNGTSSSLDVSSLVRSLLASAASSLQSQSTHVIPLASQPAQAPSSNDATASPSRITPESDSSAITIANAPDLLARMLVRAAGADRSVNANAMTATTAAANATLPAPDRGAQSPSAVAARLVAALTGLVANANSSESSNANSGGGSSARDRSYMPFDQAQTTPSATDTSATPAAGVPLTNLQTLVQHVHDAQVAQAKTDANAVIAQLVKGMVMRTNAQGDSEIRLRLQPENLGDVTMKITVQGSQISASVVAQSADVKSALLANQQHLAKALAESGLSLAGFSVDVSGGDAGRDQNRDRTSGFGRRFTVHELPGAAQSDPQTLAAIGPPLVSGAGLELFNYLA